MIWLLDTSVCVAYLRGTDEAIRDRLRAVDSADLRLCSVVKAELLYGARRSVRVAENLRRLEAFLHPFSSLPFDDAAAERYAVLRVQLEREGTPIGGHDMQIAAIALASDSTVVTRNVQEFVRVVGLRVESW